MKTLLLSTTILLLIGYFNPAYSQASFEFCDDANKVTKSLKTEYKETIRGIGINSDKGSLLILFVSPEGDNWTIMRRQPNGIGCLIASGTAWEFVEVPTEKRKVQWSR